MRASKLEEQIRKQTHKCSDSFFLQLIQVDGASGTLQLNLAIFEKQNMVKLFVLTLNHDSFPIQLKFFCQDCEKLYEFLQYEQNYSVVEDRGQILFEAKIGSACNSYRLKLQKSVINEAKRAIFEHLYFKFNFQRKIAQKEQDYRIKARQSQQQMSAKLNEIKINNEILIKNEINKAKSSFNKKFCVLLVVLLMFLKGQQFSSKQQTIEMKASDEKQTTFNLTEIFSNFQKSQKLMQDEIKKLKLNYRQITKELQAIRQQLSNQKKPNISIINKQLMNMDSRVLKLQKLLYFDLTSYKDNLFIIQDNKIRYVGANGIWTQIFINKIIPKDKKSIYQVLVAKSTSYGIILGITDKKRANFRSSFSDKSSFSMNLRTRVIWKEGVAQKNEIMPTPLGEQNNYTFSLQVDFTQRSIAWRLNGEIIGYIQSNNLINEIQYVPLIEMAYTDDVAQYKADFQTW